MSDWKRNPDYVLFVMSLSLMLMSLQSVSKTIFGIGAFLGAASIWWAFYVAGSWKC